MFFFLRRKTTHHRCHPVPPPPPLLRDRNIPPNRSTIYWGTHGNGCKAATLPGELFGAVASLISTLCLPKHRTKQMVCSRQTMQSHQEREWKQPKTAGAQIPLSGVLRMPLIGRGVTEVLPVEATNFEITRQKRRLVSAQIRKAHVPPNVFST